MKIIISEKQHELILGHLKKIQDVGEQVDTAAAQPSTGTGSSGSKEGYPEVGKWEGGVTRGPDNQIGVTKWSDVVGSKLTRGKSNQLK